MRIFSQILSKFRIVRGGCPIWTDSAGPRGHYQHDINTISTCPFGQVIRNSMRVVILGERLEMNRIGRNPYNIYSFT